MLGERKGSHFSTRDLKSIGFYVCDTLLDYCDPDTTKVELKQQDLSEEIRDLSISFLFSDQILSGRTGSFDEKAGQREAGHRFRI